MTELFMDELKAATPKAKIKQKSGEHHISGLVGALADPHHCLSWWLGRYHT